MKKYKFITIKKVDGEMFENKPVYRVYNNKSGAQIAILSYYKPWKKYVFSTQPDIVFDGVCLSNILDFMINEIK